jgi:hypothetical protein
MMIDDSALSLLCAAEMSLVALSAVCDDEASSILIVSHIVRKRRNHIEDR